MKQLLRIFLFITITMFGLAPLRAQKWEKIGWQGGKQVEIKAQLGNTLYGLANYSFYKSTDWGKTWVLFHKGLLNYSSYVPELHNFQKYLVTDSYYPPINGNQYPPFSFYYCREEDSEWSHYTLDDKQLLNVPCELNSPVPIFYFSSDTLLMYGCYYSKGYYFSNDSGNSWNLRMSNKIREDYDQLIYPFSFKSNLFINITEYISHRPKNYGSNNFGLTWDSLSMPISEHWVYDNFDLSPPFVLQDSMVLQYYGGTDSNKYDGLFRSYDLCKTWELANFPKGQTPYMGLNSVKNIIKTIGSKTFLLTLGYYGAVKSNLYISEDLGKNWRQVLTIDSNLVLWDIFGKENYYILSTLGKNSNAIQYLSADSTFTVLTPLIPNRTGILANTRTLVGIKDMKLFALPDSVTKFYDSLLVSTDNGDTWSEQLFFGENKLDVHRWIVDGNDFYATGIQKDFTPCIFRSTNVGVTWSKVFTNTNKNGFRKIFAQHDTIILIRNDDFLISIDSGKSWIVRKDPVINDSTDMVYGNSIFAMRISQNYYGNNYYDNLLSSTDFGENWRKENVPGSTGYYGTLYVAGNRMFVYIDNIYYRDKDTTNWKSSYGIFRYYPNIRSYENDGVVLYAVSNSSGYTAVFASLDLGTNWQQLGDYVSNSTDIFIGSDYFFLAGPNELWRMPKSALAVLKAPEQKIISDLSINCFPNPATTSTHISYYIPQYSDISIQAFDIMGRSVARIGSGVRDAGTYEAEWDTRTFPAGSYIIRLTAGGESTAKVVEVVK